MSESAKLCLQLSKWNISLIYWRTVLSMDTAVKPIINHYMHLFLRFSEKSEVSVQLIQ